MVPSFIAALYNSTSNDRTITAAGEMGLLMHLHENTKKHAECEKKHRFGIRVKYSECYMLSVGE